MLPLFAGFLAALFLLPAPECAAAPDARDAIPSTIKASYKVYKASIWIGTIDEQFTREGNNYKIVSVTETVGPLRLFLRDTLTVTSIGTIGTSGLKPSSYQFARRNDQKKNIFATFDWDKRQIVSNHNDISETFDLPVGTQDRLSAMYQFMFNIPRTSEVNLWMSQGKKAEHYLYKKIAEPVLTVNQEEITTVYYAREAKTDESKVHLWLGNGKDSNSKYHLPVKIVFEDEHGATLTQTMVALQTE
jgi:hypothetical protein